jgi:hypothetical protein
MTPENVIAIKQKDIYKRVMTVAQLLNKTQPDRTVESTCAEKTQKQQAVVS